VSSDTLRGSPRVAIAKRRYAKSGIETTTPPVARDRYFADITGETSTNETSETKDRVAINDRDTRSFADIPAGGGGR
jgi:hypothetical protein